MKRLLSSSDMEIKLDDSEIPRTLEANYDLGRVLGEGAFAIVKEGISKVDGTRVAAKIFTRSKMNEKLEKAIRYEADLLRGLNHPNIVRFHDFYEEKEHFYVVTEIITGGELLDRIGSKSFYTEKEARDLARTLLKAIKFMHDQNIVHR
jgi:calcium/calmodulin-dependent protein kinase I